MCSRHPEYGAGYPMPDAAIDELTADVLQEEPMHGPQTHAPAPHPYEFRGTNTCDQCGCAWKMYDLSEPNPIDDLCREPVKWHPKKCLCHSEPYVTGLLDERDRIRDEQVLMEIRLLDERDRLREEKVLEI